MSVDADSNFDPYYKWLGIPPTEQPPNYYQLLGLAMFESDADVIAAAADRQMGHVKSFTVGPYAAQSQLLLNELSKARVGLLNAKLKPVYDRQLRAQLAKSPPLAPTARPETCMEQPPRVVPRPSGPQQAAAPNVVARIVVRDPAHQRRRRRKSPIATNLATLSLGSCVIGGVLWYAASRRPDVTAEKEGDVTHDSDNANKLENGRGRLPEGSIRPPLPNGGTMPKRIGPRVDPPNPPGIPLEEDQRPEKSVLPDRPILTDKLFAEMPSAASLPDFDSGPLDLGVYARAGISPEDLQLQIVMPGYMSGGKRSFYAYRHCKTSGEVWWRLFYVSGDGRRDIIDGREVDDTMAVAVLRATDGVLSFAWLSGLPNSIVAVASKCACLG